LDLVLQASFATTKPHTGNIEYFKQKTKVKLNFQDNEEH